MSHYEGKSLGPHLGTGRKKTDRTSGGVGMRDQCVAKLEEVFFLPGLEAQRVQAIALVSPAGNVLPMKIGKAEQFRSDHYPGRTAQAALLLFLLSLFWSPLSKLKSQALFGLGAYSVPDQWSDCTITCLLNAWKSTLYATGCKTITGITP